MRRSKETAADKLFRMLTGRTPDIRRRSAREKIAEIRKADKKATTADVASKVGVSPGTVRRWERGGRPSKTSQERLDVAVQETLVSHRQKTLERRADHLTVTARVTIGSEAPRDRTMALGRVISEDRGRGGDPEAQALLKRIADAWASGDTDAFYDALAEAINIYIDQGRGYRTTVNNVYTVTF